jgi:putative phosphotransacetylase
LLVSEVLELDTEQLIRDVVKNVLEKIQQGGLASLPQSGTPQPGAQTGSNEETNNQKTDAAVPDPGVQAERPATAPVTQGTDAERKIVTGVSVRHIHLCREHLDILFGKGYILNVLRELYNPGYACKETVTVVGPRLTAIQNIRILGPLRSKTQVELSKTDCIVLGIDAPVRASGNLESTSSCVLIGPKGAVNLEEGVIRANRHLHMSTDDAEHFGIKDNDLVDIRAGGPKGLTFNNVQVRVAPDFKTEFHVDTDDGNAADLVNGSIVELVDASCVSPIAAQMAEPGKIPPSIPDGSFVGEVSDPNLLKNVCAIVTGQTCTKEQLSQTASAIASAAEKFNADQASYQQSSSTGLTKKTVITVSELDDYAQSGININGNVILTPLARDEAVKRGIKITNDTGDT